MITLYSKEACPSCIQAKNLLESVNIEFSIILVDVDFEAFDFIVEQGHRTFPQVYKNGKLFVQGGYQGLLQMWKDGELKAA